MDERYYHLLSFTGEQNIEKKQWMIKTIHDFSQRDPLFDEKVLIPLSILYDVSIDNALGILDKVCYDMQSIKIIISCLKEIHSKVKKYIHTQIVDDLLVVWEFTRLGKSMSEKSLKELHAFLDEHDFFIDTLEHEAMIQLKQREHDENQE